MSKYLLCIIIGIILYLLLNDRNGFSVGAPKLTLLRDAEGFFSFINYGDDIPKDKKVKEEWTLKIYETMLLSNTRIGNPLQYNSQEDPRTIKDPNNPFYDSSIASPASVPVPAPVSAGGPAGGPAGDPIEISMLTNNGGPIDECKANEDKGCRLQMDPDYPKYPLIMKKIYDGREHLIRDQCYNNCSGPHEEECQRYHEHKSCVQNCPLEQVKNDPTKDIQKDGFHKVNGLVELESQNFEKVKERLNTNNNNEDESYMEQYGTYRRIESYNNLLFQEYMLRRYLELKGDGTKFVKKLGDGIFYINRRIVYFKYEEFISTRISKSAQESGVVVPHKYRDFYRKTGSKSKHFPTLHTDFQNILPYEILDDDPIKKQGLSEHDYCNKLQTLTLAQSEFILLKHSGINEVIEFDDDILFLNIWVLFYGTPNVETLGFIDAIDNEKPALYNGTLEEMMKDTIHPKRLTSAFLNVVYPNTYNAITGKNTEGPSNPDIDVSKLYTYDMEAGDALVFRTDIPHIGFPPSTPGGLRMSLEDRYALLIYNFDIAEAFKIVSAKETPELYLDLKYYIYRDDDKPEFMKYISFEGYFEAITGLERILKRREYDSDIPQDKTLYKIGVSIGKAEDVSDLQEVTSSNTRTIKIPSVLIPNEGVTLPYKQPEIFQYFSEQFTFFSRVYNNSLNPSQMEKLPLDIKLFQKFMDETPYDEYYYDMPEDEKKTTISQFLQKILEEEEV